MNLKVCGITEMKQLHQLDGLDIEFAGMIFYKESPRYVANKINKKELQDADLDIRKVGVFVNPGFDEVMETVQDYNLDIVQLHGDEDPALCRKLAKEVELIKAFRVNATNEKEIEKLIKPFDEVCDYYLFDTAGPKESFGGTGMQFDWNVLNNARIEKPFFLSGGIGLDEIPKLNSFRHPDLYAIDINSKFEKSPGIKDMGLILEFRQMMKVLK
jgi:phosphoribosylanthranilate isomerase